MDSLRVGVRELKVRLSHYLQQVKAGRTLVITERGRPIGQIIPVDRPLEERLLRLVEAGLADWDGTKHHPKWPKVVNQGKLQVSELIVEGRNIDYLP
jgi:prevent-host-death family protein